MYRWSALRKPPCAVPSWKRCIRVRSSTRGSNPQNNIQEIIETFMNKLKVGVIGVGGIAKVHMPGWVESGITEVVAGCDVDPAALQVWGQLNGVSRLTTTPSDIIDDPLIDIVDICTPNNYHAPLAIAAMQAG